VNVQPGGRFGIRVYAEIGINTFMPRSELCRAHPIHCGSCARFSDRVAAFREAYRVLKPGGQFVFNVWESVAKNPIVAATLMGVFRLYPQHPSWFLERTPCGYRDTDVIRADFAAGGFADCRIDMPPDQARLDAATTARVAPRRGASAGWHAVPAGSSGWRGRARSEQHRARQGIARRERVALAGAVRPCPLRCTASSRMNSVTRSTDKQLQSAVPDPEQVAIKRRTVGK
jgi:SAM-dependent methyltransferase